MSYYSIRSISLIRTGKDKTYMVLKGSVMFVLGDVDGIGNADKVNVLWQFITPKYSYTNLTHTILLIQNT